MSTITIEIPKNWARDLLSNLEQCPLEDRGIELGCLIELLSSIFHDNECYEYGIGPIFIKRIKDEDNERNN